MSGVGHQGNDEPTLPMHNSDDEGGGARPESSDDDGESWLVDLTTCHRGGGRCPDQRQQAMKDKELSPQQTMEEKEFGPRAVTRTGWWSSPRATVEGSCRDHYLLSVQRTHHHQSTISKARAGCSRRSRSRTVCIKTFLVNRVYPMPTPAAAGGAGREPRAAGREPEEGEQTLQPAALAGHCNWQSLWT